MGVDWHTARFLIGARQADVRFDRTATLGRQNLYVGPSEINDLCGEQGLSLGVESLAANGSEYADDFFKAPAQRLTCRSMRLHMKAQPKCMT